MTHEMYPWLRTDPEGRHHIHVATGVSYVAHKDGQVTYHDREWASHPVGYFPDQAEAVAYALRQAVEVKA